MLPLKTEGEWKATWPSEASSVRMELAAAVTWDGGRAVGHAWLVTCAVAEQRKAMGAALRRAARRRVHVVVCALWYTLKLALTDYHRLVLLAFSTDRATYYWYYQAPWCLDTQGQ